MRLNLILAAAVMLGPHVAYGLEPGQHSPCKQAGLEYGDGATMCECPSLRAEGESGLVVSWRLQCQGGMWVATNQKCADVTGGSAHLIDEHRRLSELYCPRQNTAEEVSSSLAKATPSEGIVVLSSVCRRFSVPPAACAAVIEAIAASQR